MRWDRFYDDGSFLRKFFEDWRDLPTFDMLMHDIKTKDFESVDVRVCYKVIGRHIEEVKKNIAKNTYTSEDEKADIEKYGIAANFVKRIRQNFIEDPNETNTKNAARDAIFRLVGWKYKVDCFISYEEYLEIRDILEIKYTYLIGILKEEIVDTQDQGRGLSPAERQIQSTKDKIEMMKAGSTSLSEVIKARDEVLSGIDKEKEQERYEMEKRRWNDFIMDLMEKGR